MPKRHPRSQKSRRQRLHDVEAAEIQRFEDWLDLRLEWSIALIGIPAFTALIALLAWHMAFVEPAWESPVSALLIVLSIGGAITAFCWFVLREATKLWMTLAFIFHIPLAIAPVALLDGTRDIVLDRRGVTEYCTVVDAEVFESSSRSGRETMVRHYLECSGARIEQVTPFEDRHRLGDRVEATYDPEGMARPSFDGPVESWFGLMVTVALAGTVASVGIRVLYVWWRVRRSRHRKRERRAAGRRRRARSAE